MEIDGIKKMNISIMVFGFSFACLAFAFLIAYDIIVFQYSAPSHQEKIKLEIGHIFIALGIIPPLILYIISGKWRKIVEENQ